MAKLNSLCFTSPTSLSFIEPNFLSLLPSLSISSTKPSFLSLKHCNSHIYCSSSTTTLTVESSSLLSELNKQEENNETSTTRLLAQNVPWTCTSHDIRALFQTYGTVLDVELSMHSKTRNRGLAFVEMGSSEEAAVALSKLEAFEYEGRTLRLSYAKPKKKKTFAPVQSRPAVVFNLFVANLPFAARAKDLKGFFQSGDSEVVLAEVIFLENPRRSSGYGFVSFKTKKEAEAALATFEGKELMGRPIRVARSKRFVKLESELNSLSEDGEGIQAESEQTETADSL